MNRTLLALLLALVVASLFVGVAQAAPGDTGGVVILSRTR